MIKTTKIFSILLPLFLLQGCISLFPSPDQQATTVGLSLGAAPLQTKRKIVLEIEEPSAPLLYDSQKIILKKSGSINSYTHIKDQQWAERLPKMLQRALVQSLRPENGVHVAESGGMVKADYALKISIEKFDMDESGFVHLSLFATLFDAKTWDIISTKSFKAKGESTHSVSDYITKTDQLLFQQILRMRTWIDKML